MAYHFTEEQVQEAAKQCATVAELAKYLGCSWKTADRNADKYDVKEELTKTAKDLGRMAEETTHMMINHALSDYDYAASIKPLIIFTLKAQCGWRETQVLEHGLGAPFDRLAEAYSDIIDSIPDEGTENETE